MELESKSSPLEMNNVALFFTNSRSSSIISTPSALNTLIISNLEENLSYANFFISENLVLETNLNSNDIVGSPFLKKMTLSFKLLPSCLNLSWGFHIVQTLSWIKLK